MPLVFSKLSVIGSITPGATFFPPFSVSEHALPELGFSARDRADRTTVVCTPPVANLIAAVAELPGMTALPVDEGFELIAAVARQPVGRLGSAVS